MHHDGDNHRYDVYTYEIAQSYHTDAAPITKPIANRETGYPQCTARLQQQIAAR